LDIEAELKHSDARRHDTQLQIRWATYYFACLGRENASECTADKAALEKENYPFGRPGIMDINHPTHEGNEEAKHWHAVKINPSQKAEIRKQSGASVTPKPHKNEY
jgi:hypothetical protein